MAPESAVLVGDIGASNTRLALVDLAASGTLREVRLPSRDCQGLVAPALALLEGAPCPVRCAVFAVAGAVVGGRAELTNLGWSLDEGGLATELGLQSVHLINDMVAMGHAVPGLEGDAVRTLRVGQPAAGTIMAIVAPGTGLGEAFLTWNGGRCEVHPTEGGHADFAPLDGQQEELLRWLRRRYGHVSTERVCSGRALPDLYRFVRSQERPVESPALAEQMARARDQTPIIMAAASASPASPIAEAAVRLLAEILMAEAGNVALRTLALGGVYLAGGLPRRMIEVLERPAVQRRFVEKGRMTALLERIPLRVVMQPNVGLAGAIRYARSLPGAAAAGSRRGVRA
jgi:glucokinase